jgi:hypothetical protein
MFSVFYLLIHFVFLIKALTATRATTSEDLEMRSAHNEVRTFSHSSIC